MPPGVLAATLATETPQPVAALVEPPDWTWANVLGGAKGSAPLIVVLAGIAGSGKPGDDSAVGGGVWGERRGVFAGDGECVESEGGAGLCGERVSGAGAECRRGRGMSEQLHEGWGADADD